MPQSLHLSNHKEQLPWLHVEVNILQVPLLSLPSLWWLPPGEGGISNAQAAHLAAWGSRHSREAPKTSPDESQKPRPAPLKKDNSASLHLEGPASHTHLHNAVELTGQDGEGEAEDVE